MFLTILSPAKTLDFSKLGSQITQIPAFLNEANTLARIMKNLKVDDLMSLMGISKNLADLNFERYQVWNKEHIEQNSKSCIFAFNGDVYEGLSASTLTESELEFSNLQFKILSGLYGILSPLDLIQAYRLEMGVKLKNKKGSNLYAFWSDKISKHLNQIIKAQGFSHLVNLASDEYSKVVEFKKLQIPVIIPTFKEHKNGQLQFISFYAKKARGLMSRFIIQNQLSDIEHLKAFDLEGYCFNESGSDSTHFLFTRG